MWRAAVGTCSNFNADSDRHADSGADSYSHAAANSISHTDAFGHSNTDTDVAAADRNPVIGHVGTRKWRTRRGAGPVQLC